MSRLRLLLVLVVRCDQDLPACVCVCVCASGAPRHLNSGVCLCEVQRTHNTGKQSDDN